MNLCRPLRGTAEGPLFRNHSEMRKGKRMRNKNVIIYGKSLRTGLFVVCLLAVMCAAAGCGSEDKLLSELRQESEACEESMEDVQGKSDAEEFSGAPVEMLAEQEEIYVHVCGAVRAPGVYELPAGSRFYEAVEAAGGFAEDACEDYLNMAEILADGSRLEIPTMEKAKEWESIGKETAQARGKTSEGLININTADIDELCKLPGIGEGRAKAIIEYRQKQGGFQKKEDIKQVSGIGEKMYERMKEYLTAE